ncbi:hypothetical protein H4V95_002256 [Arthrobacter sp. CAN_C5]|nr:hypothetical protein [Arthrobacter sp. CAN_C5]
MVAACCGRRGIAVGFPLITSFALTTAPASHGAVVIALLPAATAVMAVIRGKEQPPVSFSVLAVIGAVAAVEFAVLQGGGLTHLATSNLLLFAAVLAAAIGYAEGGLLVRELGAWQTVSGALVIASPLMLALAFTAVMQKPPNGAPIEWAAFAYLAIVNMFLGFFGWYRGLAFGPMAQVSQSGTTHPTCPEHPLGSTPASRTPHAGHGSRRHRRHRLRRHRRPNMTQPPNTGVPLNAAITRRHILQGAYPRLRAAVPGAEVTRNTPSGYAEASAGRQASKVGRIDPPFLFEASILNLRLIGNTLWGYG